MLIKFIYLYLLLGREGDDLNIDSIFTDDVHGGYLMGEHLYNTGYKHVGYLGAPKEILCNLKRAKGFSDYYKKNNLNVSILYASWDDLSNYKNIDKFVSDGVDAIFCFNDSIAYSTIQYLQKKYPHHKPIKVTGYDNLAEYMQLPIPLSTIGTDVEKMISTCINQLMKRIKDFSLPLFVECIETKLIIHE